MDVEPKSAPAKDPNGTLAIYGDTAVEPLLCSLICVASV
jgi:hypothetical protein